MMEFPMESFAGFYRGKRVLITGHSGFKGSWLSLWLASLGAEVYGYSLEVPAGNTLFAQIDLRRELAGHQVGDIRDFAALSDCVGKVKPEIVFHLAAQSLVLPSFREPRETFDVNVMGTVNVLDALRKSTETRVCVCVTSDKCYENLESGHFYCETDPMGGSNPYSASKGCAEIAIAAYRQSFFVGNGLSISSGRAGNVIGGGDWAMDRIIPDCVSALAKNKPIVVRNPDAVRPWQHILEPLLGYLLLGRFGEAWNFGPSPTDHVTVREVVEMVIANWGNGKWETPAVGSASSPRENKLLRLDISKAASGLGWKPIWPLARAIEQTVQWYKNAVGGATAAQNRDLCLAQIRAYGDDASKVRA